MSIKNGLFAIAMCGLCVASLASVSTAQETYDLFLRIDGQNAIDNGNVDSPIIVPGSGPFSAQVILRETVNGGTSRLGDSGGLSSVNFTIGGTSGVSNSGITSEKAPFGPAGEQSTDADNRIRGIGIAGPSPRTEVRPGVFEALAGTFNFNFSAPSGQISLTDGSGGADFGVFTSTGSQNLDALMNFRTATIAVPEPGSFVLLGLGAAGMVMRRRRR